MRTWSVDVSACFLGALLLLTLPLNWILSAVIAAVFHEICHLVAIRLLGGRVWSLKVGPGGAVIETDPLSYGKELICSLAGPMGSLFLLCLCRFAPRIALCAAVQGIYNLLPIYPLDGGRALFCAANMIVSGKRAETICCLIGGMAALGILLLSVAATFVWHWGLMPLIAAFMLITKKNTLQTVASRGTIV